MGVKEEVLFDNWIIGADRYDKSYRILDGSVGNTGVLAGDAIVKTGAFNVRKVVSPQQPS